MKPMKQTIAVVIISIASFAMSCENKPLLTEMATNKLIVVIKGTYESNSPADWAMPDACYEPTRDPTTNKCTQYTQGHRALVQDDSVNDCDATDDVKPSVFMLDIAEVRLADTKGDNFKFANYRQTFAFGLNDEDPFFNGMGFVVDNDDVPSKLYPAVMLYVRKMMMDGARKYSPREGGWSSVPVWDVFAESEYPSFNFNTFQVHSFHDSLRLESSGFNRVFPMVIPIKDIAMGMVFDNQFPVTVLEIRFVVKNYIKKYEYETYNRNFSNVDIFNIIHFYGLSDWLQDVKKDEKDIGGNVLTVARSYIPGLTGSITGTNARGYDAHVIAIPAGSNINMYTIPHDPAVPGTIPSNPNDPYEPTDPIPTPPSGPRTANECDLSKKPAPYLGTSVTQALDYYLKLEEYDYSWNQKVPSTCTAPLGCCTTFDAYKAGWDVFGAAVGYPRIGSGISMAPGFLVPQLAVFARNGFTYTIENVPPGRYDVYIATRPPYYGYLYYDTEFVPGGTVTIGPGSNPVVDF
ncbi:MAG: hypothetical protein A2176_13505 [Spirochaetes bacterium RBG_13_51_14]|nr:MAG: hypothetical protein A2176_13505 [Spirochaetes bacterium RBG_13_51_14]